MEFSLLAMELWDKRGCQTLKKDDRRGCNLFGGIILGAKGRFNLYREIQPKDYPGILV